jgi:hypothetical protein
MDFAAAIAEVIAITKRPDKTTEISSNLNKAILFFTLKADFARDLIETSIAIDPTVYGETLSIATAFTRFRKIKYIRPRSQRRFLTFIDPTQLFSPSEMVQRNRFYVAGENLTFTLSTKDTHLEIGYYQYPPTIIETAPTPPAEEPPNTHWMLDMIPWAITERAASQVFKSIGDDVSARFYEASSMELFLAARRDFADSVISQAV